MDSERLYSAYRLGIGITLLYVVVHLVAAVGNYATLVVGIAQHSQGTNSAQPKLSAANLESALLRARQFRPDSQLHCESGSQGWDYVCNYMPTPTQSPTRLQFGVNVDAMRWLQVSPMRPAGTNLPPPEKRVTGGSL
jgi:hypothetical protein